MSLGRVRALHQQALRQLQELQATLATLGAELEQEEAVPPAPPRPAARRAVVCVDAGHGGTDPGAHGSGGLQEKDITLRYAQALQQLLKARGHTVAMTRSTDVYVGLADRAAASNKAGADCFISLHGNSADSKLANGAWVIHDDVAKPGVVGGGVALARCVFRRLARVPGLVDKDPAEEVHADRTPEVGGRNLAVLSQTKAPAVLVELGFLTNEEDLHQLMDPAQQQAVVEALAGAVEDWLAGGGTT